MLPVEPNRDLTAAERARYARQVSLASWGEVSQRRLAAGRVVVVGAGGLGSPALTYLVAAGVGTIRVLDDDVVAESNLHRQVVHDASSVGRPKVDSAVARLTALNPSVEVEAVQTRLEASTAMDLLRGFDVVVDGSDNFQTRYAVADACVLLGTPLVWASVLGFDGQMSVFDAASGPCFRCLFPDPPAPGLVPSCAEAGVLGVVPGALGLAQATEVVKMLSGVGRVLSGVLVVYDALAGTWDHLPVRKNPACQLCGPHATITAVNDVTTSCGMPARDVGARTLTATQLATWLAEREAGARSFSLVDIREPFEWAINQIPGAVELPMGRVLSGQLPDQEGAVVVYCHAGVRSERTLRWLLDAGVDAYHLRGGIDSWIDEVDPSLQRY